jgi:hypothetical protein
MNFLIIASQCIVQLKNIINKIKCSNQNIYFFFSSGIYYKILLRQIWYMIKRNDANQKFPYI